MKKLAAPGTVIAVLMLLGVSGKSIFADMLPAPSPDQNGVFIFENSDEKLTINHQGIISDLQIKTAAAPIPFSPGTRFSSVQVGGAWHGAASLQNTGGDNYTVAYDGIPATAHYEIKTDNSEILFTLKSIDGQADSVQIVNIPIKQLKRTGENVIVRATDTDSVGLVPVTRNVNTILEGMVAITNQAFGLPGSAAFVAGPNTEFLGLLHQVEVTNHIPFGKVGNIWNKAAPETNRGYLFTDYSMSNVDAAITAAKHGGLQTILLLCPSWTHQNGTFSIFTGSFPQGEMDLKAAVAKIHAAGLLAGLHVLANSVAWNDPLISPRPDPGVLRDLEGTLSVVADSKQTDIIVVGAQVLITPAKPFSAGDHLVIGDEILLVQAVNGSQLQVQRGALGSVATNHAAGDKVDRLANQFGMGVVDLRSPLKDKISQRVADIVNDGNFDMIYFDGNENSAYTGPIWYWATEMPAAVTAKLKRNLLTQASSYTPWLWHILARGATDDYAALQPGLHLDTTKAYFIGRYENDNYFPAELGWWGLLPALSDHPPTMPEDIEHLGIRMLAYNAPVGIEAPMANLAANARSDELLTRLGQFEALRLKGVTRDVRAMLLSGEWKMTGTLDASVFVPETMAEIRQNIGADGSAPAPTPHTLNNPYASQPLRFRLQADPKSPDVTKPPMVLATAVTLIPPSSKIVGELSGRQTFPQPQNLTDDGLQLSVANPGVPSKPPAVLNVQLQDASGLLRDHLVDLDFQGQKTIWLTDGAAARTMTDLKPDPHAYSLKASIANFNPTQVVAVNFRWMLARDANTAVSVTKLNAYPPSLAGIDNPGIQVGSATINIPGHLWPGDYLEWLDNSTIKFFDRQGKVLNTIAAPTPLILAGGANQISVIAPTAYVMKIFMTGSPSAIKDKK